MKIVFFVHRYWPSVGGVEKYIEELAGALTSRGNSVQVVAGATSDGLEERETRQGVTIHRFPARRSRLRARIWLLRRRSLFTEADVVSVSNTHMFEYFRSVFGPLVSRRKVFLIRHGMAYIHPVPESDIERARRSKEQAAGVVHDGAFIGKWLGVSPDCCPDQGLSPEADSLPFVPEPPPTSAVYIGRIEPDSGIRIYIDALSRLVRNGKREFELRVYGDGSLTSELRARAARESLPVIFHGRQSEAQRFIADSCFAFIDGRMAIQEAMARRRLVLAAYTDPLKRDYVAMETFSPFLVPVSSGRELADRVTHFIDHPGERADLVERAFAHTRTLSWHRTAGVYLDFWRRRLAETRSRAAVPVRRPVNLSTD